MCRSPIMMLWSKSMHFFFFDCQLRWCVCVCVYVIDCNFYRIVYFFAVQIYLNCIFVLLCLFYGARYKKKLSIYEFIYGIWFGSGIKEVGPNKISCRKLCVCRANKNGNKWLRSILVCVCPTTWMHHDINGEKWDFQAQLISKPFTI